MHIKVSRRTCSWTSGMVLLMASWSVQSQPVLNDHSHSWYVQAAVAANDAYSANIGVTLPWRQWTYTLVSGQVTGHWDLFASHWSSQPSNAARQRSYVLGIVPSLRWRGDQGRSAWFAQAGTGLTWSTDYYHSHDKQFSTRYNFATHLAVGTNFGARREHELMLRIEHFSNAGLKSPNPGENFLQLRYAQRF